MQAIGKATLDGILFRTLDSQKKFRSDNACVAEEYNEAGKNQAVGENFGKIKSMIGSLRICHLFQVKALNGAIILAQIN